MMMKKIGQWVRRNSVELLLILFVCLLPFEEGIHLPMLVLFVLSVRLLVRKSMIIDTLPREYLVIILLMIGPLAVSAVPAEYTWRTFETVLRWTAYMIAGLAVLHYFRSGFNDRLLIYGMTGVMAFVCVDGLIQYFTGTNLFGAPLDRGGRVMSVFYPRLRLGHVLAHLSPFMLEAIRRYVGGRPDRYWAWLLFLPLLIVLLVSGNRTAWLIMLFMLPIYAVYLIYRGQLKWWVVPAFGMIAVAGLLASMQFSEDIQKRVDRTMGAFTTDLEALDYASANRISIYTAAWEVVKQNPVVGVGWRGFRTASEEVGMPMIGRGHAHFYGLDVLLHTGVVGFIPYLWVLWLLVRLCLRNAREGNDTAFAFSLGALMLLNPFNLHYSIYYYHSAGMFLVMLMAAYGATMRAREQSAESLAVSGR